MKASPTRALVLAAAVATLSSFTPPSRATDSPPTPGGDPRSRHERSPETVREDQAFLRALEAQETSRPATRVAAAPSTPAKPVDSAALAATARQFVRDYLSATVAPDPNAEVALYADRVDYFGTAGVPRDTIERDQHAYYRRWPVRRFTLEDEPEVLRASANDVTVRFRIRYEVQSAASRGRGRTENTLRLERQNQDLRIVSIRERKLR